MKKATFGGRVQERREELHYTQEALAEVLDVSADWLLGIEPSEHRKEREERFKYIDEKIGDLSITAQDRILTVVETMINYETRMDAKRQEK